VHTHAPRTVDRYGRSEGALLRYWLQLAVTLSGCGVATAGSK
jgi:hypothetical protein